MIQGLLMLAALIIVPLVMLFHIGGFSEATKFIRTSDIANKEIKQIQADIPFLLETLESQATQDKIQHLINALLNAQDNIISTKNIASDSTNPNISKPNAKALALFKDSQTLFARDLATALQNAQNPRVLQEVLEGIYHINFADKERLSWFNGISLLGILSSLAWGLGYFGQPHILVRFMSIRSTKEIKPATFIGIGWMALCLMGACLIGILGIAYVNKFGLNLKDPEKIFIVMVQLLFNPWIAGILLSAILAAIMSTASSQLLVSSATLAEDFYKKIFKQNASNKMVLNLGKIGVLIVALIAFFISSDRNSSILSVVAYAWAGFGASFGSVMLFSLFWKRMTRSGAIAGMITGAAVVVIWKNYFAFLNLYEIIPGFLCASFAIIVVSLFTNLRQCTQDTYQAMQNAL